MIRDGRNARIICTDRKDFQYRIIAFIQTKTGTNEELYAYTAEGLYVGGAESRRDLFFAPEKKEGWCSV